MLEVRIIEKDGTCAVFKNVVGIQSEKIGSIIYTDDKPQGRIINWDAIKAIKVVKK